MDLFDNSVKWMLDGQNRLDVVFLAYISISKTFSGKFPFSMESLKEVNQANVSLVVLDIGSPRSKYKVKV